MKSLTELLDRMDSEKRFLQELSDREAKLKEICELGETAFRLKRKPETRRSSHKDRVGGTIG